MSNENLEMVELAKQWMKDANGAPSVPVVAYDLAEGLAKRLDESLAARSEKQPTLTREDCAKIIERKAKALTEEYCHGDAGPGGYVWWNKEAEWQVILLEELAEEIRNAKGI